VLPTSQSYTDGEVVAWNQEAEEGAEEPDKPAPSFVTTAAAEGEDAHGGSHTTAGTPEAMDAEQASSSTDAGSASAVAWVGLVAGLLGLAAGAVALARTRRRA
jgi:hypothetical protein